MANIMDLLGDGMKTVRKNNNISLLYILYQVRFYHRTDIRAEIGFNKNASQLDAYRPLQWPQESVYIPACTGQGVCIPACTGQGVCLPGGVCPGSVSQHALGRGCVCLGGVYPRGCLPRGCLLGVSAPVHAGKHTPPHEQNQTPVKT